MSIVVDGGDWVFNGKSEQEIAVLLDEFLGRAQTARERQETVWIGDDLQTSAVFDGLDIWSLSSSESPIQIPFDIWQELAAFFSRAPRYADEPIWPPGMEEVRIETDDRASSDNPDLAWAHHSVRAGKAVGCLGLTTTGVHHTVSSLGAAQIHWVTSESTHRQFWRDAIEIEGDSASTLERFASHAFPDLFFVDGVWSGLGRLAGGYTALRTDVRKCLATLDDYGYWAFQCPPPALSIGETSGPTGILPSNQIIERRFLGLGLTMAPEKPNVYLDNRCRTSREVTVGTRTLYCEWHQKFEPHRNRLHVHGPTAETDNKVVIAIFDEHLPLP